MNRVVCCHNNYSVFIILFHLHYIIVENVNYHDLWNRKRSCMKSHLIPRGQFSIGVDVALISTTLKLAFNRSYSLYGTHKHINPSNMFQWPIVIFAPAP